MTKSIGVITAVAFTIAAVVSSKYVSISADAASKALGPMTTNAQINVLELTKNARGLPAQEYPAF
jgi:hypothetical protein